MTEPTGAESRGARDLSVDAAVYVDSSALVKLYVPEPESERLDRYLRGQRALMISELAITEVLSAVARRKREKELRPDQAIQIRDAVLEDAGSGAFDRLHLSPLVHRQAEHLLLAVDSLRLRSLDALHIALALSAGATCIVTFDRRMQDAASQVGLHIIEL